MFLLLIAVAIILCAVIVYLPYASGLTTVEKNKRSKTTSKPSSHSSGAQGYIPPDEDFDQGQSLSSLAAKASALKEKVNVTSSDLPVQIKLSNVSSIRKRKEKLDLDTDPNKYDYDLDELIEEESRTAAANQQAEFYKDQVIGKEKEEMV